MFKKGPEYLASPEKRALELAIIGAASPGLAILGLGVASALCVTEGPRGIIARVPRSVHPGERHMMWKFGDQRKNNPLQKNLRKTMLDELPQVWDVLKGDLALSGPRDADPAHLDALCDSLSDCGLREAWLEVRTLQKPGIISTYAILSHGNNLEALREEERFRGLRALQLNAAMRAYSDIDDFEQASMQHDLELLRSAAQMAVANYGTYIRRALPLGTH